MNKKPILCLDFDGVCSTYASGWCGIDVIPDPPVTGLVDFILGASEHFRVAIYSSRSEKPEGIEAMQKWFAFQIMEHELRRPNDTRKSDIYFPTSKPAAFVSIDDRALTFSGTWPSVESLLAFRSWVAR